MDSVCKHLSAGLLFYYSELPPHRIKGDNNDPLMNHRLPLAEDVQEEVLQDLEEKLPLSSRPLLPFPQGGRWEPKKLFA